MNDILPPDVAKWQFVEEKARTLLDAFAYRELRTPVVEYTPLFTRSVGEATEVVEKQMYTFDDQDGKSVSLRPEGTASAVRAYIAASLWNHEPITRWYYLGPMFRHEQAQRGRLRQFHQVGAEVFGVREPSMDAEMIAMLVALLTNLGIGRNQLEVAVGSLGAPEERAAYRETLRAYFAGHVGKLDDFSRRRLETNPLRILDSKDPEVQALVAQAPVLCDLMGEGSRQHLATVRGHLAHLGVDSVLDPRLVRGLDYYTSTVFENQGQGRQSGGAEHRVRWGTLRQAGRVPGRPRRTGPGFRHGGGARAPGHGGSGCQLRAWLEPFHRHPRRPGTHLHAAHRPASAPGRHTHRDRASHGRPQEPAQARRRTARQIRPHCGR